MLKSEFQVFLESLSGNWSQANRKKNGKDDTKKTRKPIAVKFNVFRSSRSGTWQEVVVWSSSANPINQMPIKVFYRVEESSSSWIRGKTLWQNCERLHWWVTDEWRVPLVKSRTVQEACGNKWSVCLEEMWFTTLWRIHNSTCLARGKASNRACQGLTIIKEGFNRCGSYEFVQFCISL